MICGGDFGRISVYSQVYNPVKLDALTNKGESYRQKLITNTVFIRGFQVVAPRTIGLNVQLTNAAGENVARCLICSAHHCMD